MGVLGDSDEKEEVMTGLLGRGDSGGGVSQPISDTGEPFFTYGVASRMYLTGEGSNKDFQYKMANKKQHLFKAKYIPEY